MSLDPINTIVRCLEPPESRRWMGGRIYLGKLLNQFQHPQQLFGGYPQSVYPKSTMNSLTDRNLLPLTTSMTCTLCAIRNEYVIFYSNYLSENKAKRGSCCFKHLTYLISRVFGNINKLN